MRYMGLDYGAKRVGLAFSDTEGRIAFPHAVLPNDRMLMTELKSFCREKKVEAIVLGESKNFKGEPNSVMKKILPFEKLLGLETGLPVYLEPEFMTSAAAERIQGKNPMQDASAAALILQSYLDQNS